MKSRKQLDEQEALICTMVLVAAAEKGGITDSEIGVMSALVQTLPVFHRFSAEQLTIATEAAIQLLREEDGLNHAGKLIRDALSPKLRETAYVLACEVVAADRLHSQSILEMLEFMGEELELDKLTLAAIERSTKARYQRLPNSDH